MAAKYTSSAKIVDGILVLSLPDAIHPVVWQMELGQSKSSALEIREQLEHQVDAIIEGGYCGIDPTTVIDLTDDVPVLIRQGAGDTSLFGFA